jgi:lycopene cyclase domain-containing protein
MIPLNYIILDALIIIFPLLFSFMWKFKYYKFFKPLAASIAIVGISYIIWDVLVTYRGDWWFDKDFLIGIEILGLPIEEILFFIIVPFSCIFIYENLVYFVKEKKIFYNKILYLTIAGIFIIMGIIFRSQEYTVLAMFSCALFFILAITLYPRILKNRNYWLYIILSFIPFMIFNYFLTSLIVVHYNPNAIWGIRITTIPLEDFFYNYSMLSFYLMVYMYFKERWIISKNIKKEK